MAGSSVRPANTEAIEKATGASWRAWCAFLDEAGAADMEHSAIVRQARGFKPISGWWAQGVAVAYEQHIGRRKPGQVSDGSFSVSLTRTLAMPQQGAFDKWCALTSGLDDIGGQAIAETPTTSITPKRCYWRCRFEDGSRGSVAFERKDGERSVARVEHTKIADEVAMPMMKEAWTAALITCFGEAGGR